MLVMNYDRSHFILRWKYICGNYILVTWSIIDIILFILFHIILFMTTFLFIAICVMTQILG